MAQSRSFITRYSISSCLARISPTRRCIVNLSYDRALCASTHAAPRLFQPIPTNASWVSRKRHHSSETVPRPLTDSQRSLNENADTESDRDAIARRKAEEPAYELTFTCRKCLTRSSHRVTKQAYHYGTTLITCPGCKNRHLISDHLKIFSDTSITLEDILKEKGEFLQKGRLGEDGDVEFYEDTPEHRQAIQRLATRVEGAEKPAD